MATIPLTQEWPAPQMSTVRRKKLLLISSAAEDCEALVGLLEKTQWDLLRVDTYRAAMQLITSHAGAQQFSAIFCEAELSGLGWRDLLEPASVSETPPLVVCSRLADAVLWCEVLNLGGYDVLAKPFDSREVAHVLETISRRQASD